MCRASSLALLVSSAEAISNVRPRRIYELRHLVVGITLPPYTYKLLFWNSFRTVLVYTFFFCLHGSQQKQQPAAYIALDKTQYCMDYSFSSFFFV